MLRCESPTSSARCSSRCGSSTASRIRYAQGSRAGGNPFSRQIMRALHPWLVPCSASSIIPHPNHPRSTNPSMEREEQLAAAAAAAQDLAQALAAEQSGRLLLRVATRIHPSLPPPAGKATTTATASTTVVLQMRKGNGSAAAALDQKSASGAGGASSLASFMTPPLTMFRRWQLLQWQRLLQ